MESAGGAIAIGLDPAGMLHAQGVMDLLLELNVRMDFVRHGNSSVKVRLHRRCYIISLLIGY
ncbi:MAG TPA: hypothetical protein VFU37_18825 [Pyrinomonadaceae bacterium]|nr:hypothetical protein [Pyrinomonadaceae bacterium]